MSPRSTTPMFLSLDPEPAIESLVRRSKRRVRQLAGEQLYLSDPPHLTCYLAHFSDSKPVIAAAAKLAEELPAPEIDIIGWHVFQRDQLTGNNTLVLNFDDETQSRLRFCQSQVIEAVSLLRDGTATRAHFSPRWGALSVEQRCSVEEHGFPFTGAAWHPHLTVASIRPADWPRIEESLLAETPHMSGCCPGLTVYRLEGLEPVAIAAFPLRSCEVSA